MNKSLGAYCTNLAKSCGDAAGWIDRNPDLVRNEREGLLKDLRRAGRNFRRCARAAERKMCAGVFGPSQAGKSYLISALAMDANGTLGADFSGEEHDFISEINPPGGKESTGLVTRFTMSRPDNTPPGHPVQLRLLSETDLVKILANTYYADCEHKEEAQSNIEKSLKKIQDRVAQSQAVANSPIDLDALEDLREYLLKNFRAKARVQNLEREYWDLALKLGPKLDLEGRVALYALLWDEVEEFTNLLRDLLKALESLGHAEEAFAGMDALIPREQSIIDVATLAGLEAGKDSTAPPLELLSPAGHKAMLPRALVTALTAELTIVMREKPADYFEHTDLLDFPGYRSRYKFEDIRRELKKDDMLQELFLRGKVAYLFQRYCAERELTSMLLCIGPSNQEVQDLPGVINDWIGTSFGEQPEDRRGKQVSLFLILTKSDMEFENKKGAPSVKDRWDNRLHASLLGFFGKQHDWPQNWTPGRGFDNIFLLRNPNVNFSKMESDADGREKGIRPENVEEVKRLEEAFLQSPTVAAHFRDPKRAWDELMRLNDGGISYIRESLGPLCNPDLKREQLLQNLKDMREQLARRLRPFYRSDDLEVQRREKMLLIRQLFGRLGQLEEKQKRLGLLLRSFTLSDTALYDLHPEAMRRFNDLAEAEAAKALEATEPADLGAELDLDNFDLAALNPFASQAEAAPDAPDAKAAKPAKENEHDKFSFYAGYVESHWVENLHRLADDPAAQKFFMLPGSDFSALVSELATAVSRLGLRERMAQDFRKAAAYANTSNESIVRKQAAIAARLLNSFVDWLGLDPLSQDAEKRSVLLPGGKKTELFNTQAEFEGMPKLSEKREPWTKQWLGDWLNALAALILTNLNFDGEHNFNMEENAALGAILRSFESLPEA